MVHHSKQVGVIINHLTGVIYLKSWRGEITQRCVFVFVCACVGVGMCVCVHVCACVCTCVYGVSVQQQDGLHSRSQRECIIIYHLQFKYTLMFFLCVTHTLSFICLCHNIMSLS